MRRHAVFFFFAFAEDIEELQRDSGNRADESPSCDRFLLVRLITDRDSVISVCGAPRRDLGEKRISGELSEMMDARQSYTKQAGEKNLPVIEGQSAYSVSIAVPILSEGDVLGCVMFLDGEDAKPAGEVENKLAQTVAGFLGKQMEN